jgi:endonuclease/exonuclease/phosphatase family metal-dependent hydrolase
MLECCKREDIANEFRRRGEFPRPGNAIEPLESRVLLSHSPVMPASKATPAVTVMTQNLYYGGAFDSIFGAGGGGLPNFNNVRATNFPQRATTLAKEIRANQPDLIALQEAVIWRTGNVLDLGSASHVEYDFTQTLLRALRRQRMNYAPAAVATNADIAVPGSVDGQLRTIRMTDQDVILARTDLPRSQLAIFNSRSGSFSHSLKVPVPVLGSVSLTRGWASVDAKVGGQTFRFIDTHLEAFNSRIQQAQARELLQGPANTKLPVILAGDFNAGPVFNSSTYASFTKVGFQDAWSETNPSEAGLTCCQDSSLRSPDSQLLARVDLILHRGPGLVAQQANVVGDTPADRTPSGLWPSDHAGVVATLSVSTKSHKTPLPFSQSLVPSPQPSSSRFAAARRAQS